MSETMHSLLSVTAALREERASLRSLLKSIEWKGQDCTCPACGAFEPSQAFYAKPREPRHEAGCGLADAIREAP